jgi:hypothetical protein
MAQKRSHPQPPNRDLWQPPNFDSMAHCSSVAGIPMQILKRAKKGGCHGFDDHGRVNLFIVLKWIFENPEYGENEVGLDWGEQYKKFRALTQEVEYNKVKLRTIDRGIVQNVAKQVMTLIFNNLRKFAHEMPPLLKGRTEQEIKVKIEEGADVIEQKVREGIERLRE